MTKWNAEELCGYTPITTFWDDFSIADCFGKSAVQDTFNRAFAEWKSNSKYLTELAMVLNHKSWQHYETNTALMELYSDLYYVVYDYATENLKSEEIRYFFEILD